MTSVRLYLRLSCRRAHVLFMLFVGGLMSYLCYLCLYAHSGVQHVLGCVFVFLDFVLCTLSCQFLCIVHFWLPLRYSLTFICVKYGSRNTQHYHITIMIPKSWIYLCFLELYFWLLQYHIHKSWYFNMKSILFSFSQR
jgi:hypothetical protein